MLEILTNIRRSVANQRIHYAEFERGEGRWGKRFGEETTTRSGRDMGEVSGE